jgi:hypothetical protein
MKSKACGGSGGDATTGYFIKAEIASVKKTGPAVVTTLELTFALFGR